EMSVPGMPSREGRVGKAADLAEPAGAEEEPVGRSGGGARGQLATDVGARAEDGEGPQRRRGGRNTGVRAEHAGLRAGEGQIELGSFRHGKRLLHHADLD